MNKKMRDLQAQILQKNQEVQACMTEGEGRDLDKAEKLLDEIDDLQKRFDLEARAEKAAKAGIPADAQGQAGDGEEKPDAIKAFATAARNLFKSNSNLNETTGADGGYTVPQDISTKINEYKQERFSLVSLIDQESVSTLSGKRTYKTRAQHTGFAKAV